MSPQEKKESVNQWPEITLAEVCEPQIPTRDPRRDPDAEFSYVDISSVDNDLKRILNPKRLCGAEAPSRARQCIRAGDVLVATTRPNLNAVALVSDDLDGQIASTGFCVLRPRPPLDSEYLFAFVRSQRFVDSVSDLVKGAMYPAVTDSQVRVQRIPLPPHKEQQRIAANLRERLSEVELARAAIRTQLITARALAKAHLRAVFESTRAQDWPTWQLGDLLTLRSEVVHPRNNPSGPATFVGLEHIEPHTGKRTGSVEIETSQLTGRKPRFLHGDIIYGYLRPYLNKVWVAEFDGLCSVDQYVYAVNQEKADARFIACFMRSPTYLRRAPIGQTPGQLPRIRTEEVASVEINLPPLLQQQLIAQQLTGGSGDAEELRESLLKKLAAVERLPSSLLAEAFRATT